MLFDLRTAVPGCGVDLGSAGGSFDRCGDGVDGEVERGERGGLGGGLGNWCSNGERGDEEELEEHAGTSWVKMNGGT